MPKDTGGEIVRVGQVGVDFSRADADLAGLKESLSVELARIATQLRVGYRFKSDRILPPDRLDPVDNHVEVDGVPRFQSFRAAPADIAKAADRIRAACGDFRNVVLIGNGGSISSSEALYAALIRYSDLGKRLLIVDSMDPDQIASVKAECRPEDTVAVVISKSGTTQGVLDAFDQFAGGYHTVAITDRRERRGDDGRPLNVYSKVLDRVKESGMSPDDMIVAHPPIGGRYTGRTPVGTLPMALLGMRADDLAAMDRGALGMYGHVGPAVPIDGNPALRLASTLYRLERTRGVDEIFAPMYSHRFDGFAHLATQLLHESSGKAGEGQTMLAAAAPESQHHTNQRLFGGKRNMACVFFTIANPQVKGMLASDGVPLEKALRFEYEGTRDDATDKGIPNITVQLERMNPESAGALMAFLHFAFGVYPALLRDVNPFDQPQVEASKSVSRGLRAGLRRD
jgi:glucose-6-phosphate isomerase